ncbi:MAG: DNA methyltransferase [Myxococcota bacterium]
MDSVAKKRLSTTIRALRTRLLADLHAATESTYRLSIPSIRDAGLDEAPRLRRQRLQSWIEEQRRAQHAPKGKSARASDAFRLEAEKQAAYTLLNRLVLLRLMEASTPPLRAPALITGGWESRAYKDFRELAPDLCQRSGRLDESEGYAFLLRLTFEELALELPGLFGPAGVAELIPIPPATLRFVIDALNDPALDACWTDDMTLGWVYQYWNDPEREALDEKLNAGGKVEPHELASKTQMFTERYMVDWLLHNTLGPLWLALCQKQGWTPEVRADGTLERLEARRQAWREKRASGEVALHEPMPLHTDAERRWAYYVPQGLPADAVEQAPDSLRALKILDPAVGSGHFLVAALGLLLPLYQEEARHRKQVGSPEWSERACVEHILAHNLHGIDLDPRAVQMAAAALWLKARLLAPDAHPERLNLVASQLRLTHLPENDPALLELEQEVTRETGIPETLTQTLVRALNGADHLGSLLKVNAAVDEAMRAYEVVVGKTDPQQLSMFGTPAPQQARIDFEALQQKRQSLEARLEQFLARHSTGDDLGLRLRGEQLSAGVRFVRLVREGNTIWWWPIRPIRAPRSWWRASISSGIMRWARRICLRPFC